MWEQALLKWSHLPQRLINKLSKNKNKNKTFKMILMIKIMVKTHQNLMLVKNLKNQELHQGVTMIKIKAMMRIYVLVKHLTKLLIAVLPVVRPEWILYRTRKKISFGAYIEAFPLTI